MTATKDLLGWALVLRQWNPEEPNKQLFTLLGDVQVKSSDESELLEFFQTLDIAGLRKLLQIPTNSYLKSKGMPEQEVESIEVALPHLLGMDSFVIDAINSCNRQGYK